MEEKKYKEIELRSEEVQEVMGEVPSWIIRRGITVLFLILVALFTGSFFFRYPDVISAEMTLTSLHPAAQIVARTSGKINKLYVADHEEVAEGSKLAVIENPASTEDLLWLKKQLSLTGNHPDSARKRLYPLRDLTLGSVQTAYAAFLRSLYDYENYRTLNYYPQKIASVQKQIGKYEVYYQSLEKQYLVMRGQYEIARKQFTRDSLLFVRQVLSEAEYETSKSTLLQSRYSLDGAHASLESQKIQISQLEETLLDLKLQQSEKEANLLQEYRSAAEQLNNEIAGWELNYLLVSPIDGRVTFNKYWNENQYVVAAETIFTVVPEKKEELIGKALLPVARSGKVKTGQRVIIRFSNFPDQEFGVVNGVVSSISLVPLEQNYMVAIDLPDGLVTNYRKTLPAAPEMTAQADIVTNDLRLIERFFQPLKQILKAGFDSSGKQGGETAPAAGASSAVPDATPAAKPSVCPAPPSSVPSAPAKKSIEKR